MKFQLFPVTLALILFTSLTSLKSCDAAPVSDSQSSIRHDIPPVTKQPPSVPSTNLCFFDFPSQLAQKYQIRAPFKLPVRRFDVSASYRKHIWQGATRPGRDQRLWESEFKNKFLCWNTEEAARKAVISQGSNWRCSLYTDNLRRFQHVYTETDSDKSKGDTIHHLYNTIWIDPFIFDKNDGPYAQCKPSEKRGWLTKIGGTFH